MGRFGNGPVGTQLLSRRMLPAKSSPAGVSACDRAKQRYPQLCELLAACQWPNLAKLESVLLLITMKKIRAVKDIPIQILIPLLLIVVLAASGAKRDPQRESDVASWQRVLDEATPAQDHLAERDALARRQAQAAIALTRLGKTERLWPLLRHSPDPTLRSYLIRDLGRSGISPELIIQRLEVEPDTSTRRALILTLGGFSANQLPLAIRASIIVR